MSDTFQFDDGAMIYRYRSEGIQETYDTYRVSKATCFPTHRLRSHSREGNAPGSSMFPFAFDAILKIERSVDEIIRSSY